MIAKYVTNMHKITDTYKEIILDARDTKVKIEPSNDNNTSLIFFEKKRRPYEYFIQGDILTIKPIKTRWYHFLTIGISRSEIKLRIPESTLDKISVKSNVGRVDMSSIKCNGDIDIQTSTGKVDISDISCKSFTSKGNTGSIALNKLIARDSVNIQRNTGKVLLNDCNAREFFVKTNTGNVSGRLPAGTVFITKTNTGKAEIPKTEIGELVSARCEVTTNTGRIKFE